MTEKLEQNKKPKYEYCPAFNERPPEEQEEIRKIVDETTDWLKEHHII